MTVHTTSTLVALLLVSSILQGQIKDKYQDTNNGLTTVVVKEDAANDMDILNNQFDLDEVGMHQVIRITTRQEPAPKLEETIQTEVVTPAPSPEVIAVTATKKARPQNSVVSESSSAPLSYSIPSSTTYNTTGTKRNKKTFKTFNQRYKKQKRKRAPKRKKRNKRCYRF